MGSYLTKADAQAALDSMTQGTIVGTSSYGINVVETGTDNILFQYDNSSSPTFAVLPDVTGEDDVRTWFLGFKYRGGFTYQRIDGGNLTVANVLDLENYVKGVACYEMGRSWPLEALKAQSICARTYALVNLGTHNSLGFDVCNTDYCQVYHGAGSNRTDYGPSETSDQAVEETAGMVLWYENTLAETYYSSSHGGASEEVANVWGSNDPGDYPYLCGVIDPYESTIADLNPYSSWTVSYTASSLASRLQGYGYGVNTSIDHLELTYSELGNVLKIVVHWKNGSTNTFRSTGSGSAKTDIRTTFGLRSIRFTVNDQTVTVGGSSPSTGDGYLVNGSGSVSGTDGLYVISGSGTVSQAGDDLYTISGSGSVSALEPGSGSSGGDVCSSAENTRNLFVVGPGPCGLHNPACNGRNREIADNRNQQENQVNRVRRIRQERVIADQFDVPVQRQNLNLRKHGAEQVGDRQPKIDRDIARKPIGQGRLKPVVDADCKSNRPQNRKDHQIECPQGVDHQRRSPEQDFQQPPE